MNLSDVNEQTENISEDKKAILKLIDIKIEDDMNKVLNEIKRVEDKMDTQYKMLLWAMGIMIALIVALKFFAA